jgi:hypothetical protein
MKENSITGPSLYDETDHDNDFEVMGDVSSYRAGDSVADTVVASSAISNQRFIVRGKHGEAYSIAKR